MSASKKHFILKVRSQNVANTVFMNDIPVFSDQWRSETDKQVHVNQFILEGGNPLRVVLHVPPDMEAIPKDITYTLSIEAVEGTEASHTVLEMIRIDWTLLSVEEFPVVIEGGFTVSSAYGPWEWQDGETVEVDTLDKEGLFGFVKEVRDALMSKSFDHLNPYLANKRKELGRAYGFPEADLEKEDRELFETMFKSAGWNIADFDPGNLILEPMAQGKMLRLLRPNGKDILRTDFLEDLELIYSLPLDLIRKSGRWMIVR